MAYYGRAKGYLKIGKDKDFHTYIRRWKTMDYRLYSILYLTMQRGTTTFEVFLKKNIVAQHYPVANIELSPGWAGFKKKHGLDKRTLFAWRIYTKGIYSYMKPAHKVFNFASLDVNMESGIYAKDGLEEVAKALEFGAPSRNLPPRPHWRPLATLIGAYGGGYFATKYSQLLKMLPQGRLPAR